MQECWGRGLNLARFHQNLNPQYPILSPVPPPHIINPAQEELEQQMMGETPIVMESPDLPADESPELPRTASSEESDTDGDSFPPTSSHHLDVDPK